MPHPLLIVSQSDALIQIVDINSHSEWQTVQIKISWLLKKPTDLDLHCLQMQGSAGQELKLIKILITLGFFTCKSWLNWLNSIMQKVHSSGLNENSIYILFYSVLFYSSPGF